MVHCNATLSETHWEVDPVVGNLSLHTLGWLICSVCAAVSCVISFFLMYRHATNYTKPEEQRHIIRILLMIPIYAVTTMFSYVWYWHAVYWEFGRDCYEAFAIAAFFALMCQYIAPDLKSQKEYFATMKVDPWPWPINWLNKCCGGKLRAPRNGLTWFNVIWFSVFQYCFIRVATTVVATVTQYFGVYCEESLHPAFFHLWSLVLNVTSVTVAMYMLIAFYLNIKTEIEANKPLLKLLCIKLVIFFSFWQMILFDFLASSHVIKPNNKMSQGDISIGINALLICFEMIIFSTMHLWAFPWADYRTSALGQAVYKQPPRSRAFKALWDTFNLFDMVKAFGRGLKWVFIGSRRRHAEAEQLAARRQESLRHTATKKTAVEEEGESLVNNAAEMEMSDVPGGYSAPSELAAVGRADLGVGTEHTGHRPPPEKASQLPYPTVSTMPSIHVQRPSAEQQRQQPGPYEQLPRGSMESFEYRDDEHLQRR